MSGDVDVYNAPKIAQAFHEAYERLAPRYGYETRQQSAVPWRQVPKRNRDLMTATVESLLDAGTIRGPERCSFVTPSGRCSLGSGHTQAHHSYTKRAVPSGRLGADPGG